jgi:MoxR-like ATPase
VDRFMMKVLIDYPSLEEERLIIRENLAKEFPKTNPVLKPADITRARDIVREVYMDEKIENYILNIVFASRDPEKYGLPAFTNMISYGASPRASIYLSLAAKAFAFIRRRGYVIPEDVRAICADVMRHRIGLTYEAEAENVNQDKIIAEILNVVEVP